MEDCQIVLRFLALRDESRISGSVRGMLDSYMKENRNADPPMISECRQAFKGCLELAHAIFGQRTFQIPANKGKWVHSKPLYDAVMVSVEKLMAQRSKLINNRTKVLEALSNAMNMPDVYEIIVGRPNTAKAIKNRISIVHKLMGQFA